MLDDFATDNPELEALFERYVSNPDSHVFAPLADGCRKAGMLQAALEICEKGLERNPGYVSGYVVQGKCHYDLRDAEAAEESFQKVLTLDGRNLVALKYLGMILAERGDADGARERFRDILAFDPGNRDIALRLEALEGGGKPTGRDVPSGEAEREPGQPVETRDDHESFEGRPITMSDAPETPDELATMTLAGIYATQGYTEKAARIYRELLRSQPDNDVVRDRLAALESGSGGVAAPDRPRDRDPVPQAPEDVIVPAEADGTAQEPAGEPVDNAPEPEPVTEAERGDEADRTVEAEPTAEPESTSPPPKRSDDTVDTDPEMTTEDRPPEPRKTPKTAAPTGNDPDGYDQFRRWLDKMSK